MSAARWLARKYLAATGARDRIRCPFCLDRIRPGRLDLHMSIDHAADRQD